MEGQAAGGLRLSTPVVEKRPFGSPARLVAAIGQGTWRVRGAVGDKAVSALRRGIDLGLTHIDTAELYDDAESVIGRAIAGRRDEVFLVSKVLPQNASRRGTVAACEQSLRNLETDVLDCYLLHWRGSIPLEETIEAFESLEAAGKIRSWGVSNFDEDDLAEALAIAGPGRIACNQVLYHLGERAIEHAVIPWCERHGVAVVAYTPFGPDAFPGPRSRGGAALEEIAKAHGASPRQVALGFLLREPSVLVIPKAIEIAHVEDNAAAARLRLSDGEIARIDAAFPRGPKPRSLPMV